MADQVSVLQENVALSSEKAKALFPIQEDIQIPENLWNTI